MDTYFLKVFITDFVILFAGLLLIKTFVVSYRIAIKKWPPSTKFLIGIVEWNKEALKISAVVLLAVVVTVIRLHLL